MKKMKIDVITNEIRNDNTISAEIVIYSKGENGGIIRETITIDYFGDDDYQWSTSVKPLLRK